jgi:hypothetical protein
LDPSPSLDLFDNGNNGGGERVSYCHPSSQSEHARGQSGYNGGIHIATWQGEEIGQVRNNVGCDLFFDPSPSSYSFDDGDEGERGDHVTTPHCQDWST